MGQGIRLRLHPEGNGSVWLPLSRIQREPHDGPPGSPRPMAGQRFRRGVPEGFSLSI